MRFSSFLNKKANEARKQLKIMKEILSESELKVKDLLDADDPYLFVDDPDGEMEFGIRIYKVGSEIAYRVQRRADTNPYGEAYPLNIESSFADLVSDMDEDEAADKIKRAVVEEVKAFFKKSAEARDELVASGSEEGLGRVTISSAGDISNSMSVAKG